MDEGLIRAPLIGRDALAVLRGAAIEWRTVVMIAGCYGAWACAGLMFRYAPAVAILLMSAAVAFHSSLQHEAIHRHPTRRQGWNEALVFLPLGLLVPFRRYRDLHLRHHQDSRLTDPFDDPESWYLGAEEFRRLPHALQRVRMWANTLVGRLSIGPAIVATSLLRAELPALTRAGAEAAGRRRAWALHAIGLIAVAAIVQLLGVPLPAYLAAAYLALSLLSLRAFCEHRWADAIDHRTVIVERSWLGWLFLNNNLHLVHHRHPELAWYELPAAYRARRAEWRAANAGYVYHGYHGVLRAHAFRAKEPVVHPARVASEVTQP